MKEIKKLVIDIPEIRDAYEDFYKKIQHSQDFEKKLNQLNCKTLLALDIAVLIKKGFTYQEARFKLNISFKQGKDISTIIKSFLLNNSKRSKSYLILKNRIKNIMTNKEYCHITVGNYGILLNEDLKFNKTIYNRELIFEEIMQGKSITQITNKFNIPNSTIYKLTSILRNSTNNNSYL
jgi:hypothetical protein